MTENKNILEVHHLKKSFTTGKKILHGCRRHKLFSENWGSIRDRR